MSCPIITREEFDRGFIQIVDGLVIRRGYEIIELLPDNKLRVKDMSKYETPVHRTSL